MNNPVHTLASLSRDEIGFPQVYFTILSKALSNFGRNFQESLRVKRKQM